MSQLPAAVTIPELPPGTTPSGSEQLEAVQGGNSVALTVTQINTAPSALLTGSPFVVSAASAGLSASRTLTGTAGLIALVDGGPAGSLTITIPAQLANLVMAGPVSGGAAAPTFRALVATDIPAIAASTVTFVPTGRISSTNVQSALAELDVTLDGLAFNVLDYGALGNGVVSGAGIVGNDDTAAIQAAITAASVAGGIVYFPPTGGIYYCPGGLTVSSSSVVLQGCAQGTTGKGTIIDCGTNDVVLLSVSASFSTVKDLTLRGNNATNATQPTLKITTAVVSSIFEDMRVQHGTGILYQGVDCIFDNVTCNNVYGSGSTAAIFRSVGTSGVGYFLRRCKLDMTFPQSANTPATGSLTLAARQDAHPYNLGDLVTSGGYVIQCTVAGTTTTGAPALQPYGTNIVDGSSTWRLACPSTFYGVLHDTGSSTSFIHDCDISGASTVAIGLLNSNAGIAPQNLTITDTDLFPISKCFSASVGSDVLLSGVLINGVLDAAGVGIETTGTFLEHLQISDCQINSCPIGIKIGAGTGTLIADNVVAQSGGTAIDVLANVNRFSISGCKVGTSSLGFPTNGIVVNAGTSDDYVIIANNTKGATNEIVDNGTGVTKTVQRVGATEPGLLRFVARGINANSANTDTTIPVSLPPGVTRYRLNAVFLSGTNGNISSMTFGVFPAAAGAGTAVVATGTACTITTGSADTLNNLQAPVVVGATTIGYDYTTLYFRVQTASGVVGSTFDVTIEVQPI